MLGIACCCVAELLEQKLREVQQLCAARIGHSSIEVLLPKDDESDISRASIRIWMPEKRKRVQQVNIQSFCTSSSSDRRVNKDMSAKARDSKGRRGGKKLKITLAKRMGWFCMLEQGLTRTAAVPEVSSSFVPASLSALHNAVQAVLSAQPVAESREVLYNVSIHDVCRTRA